MKAKKKANLARHTFQKGNETPPTPPKLTHHDMMALNQDRFSGKNNGLGKGKSC